MATTIKATDSTSMEIKENQSIVVEDGMGTTRLVTCKDGTKEPYSETNLRASLDRQLEGLNKDYLNLDIIMTKVSSGLYNGKPSFLSPSQVHSPLMASILLIQVFLCGATSWPRPLPPFLSFFTNFLLLTI